MAKTISEIRSDLREAYAQLIPTLDLSEGSTETDVFIEAPAIGGFLPIHSQLQLLENQLKIFTQADDLPSDTVDRVALDNYNTGRIPAKSAFGIATYYTASFTSPITIPSGSRLQTVGATPKKYVTVGTAVFSNLDAPTYFNALTNRYEFKVSIQSLNKGTGTGTGKNSITVAVDSIQGINGVTNEDSIPDGIGAETNSELMSRIARQLVGRSINTQSGFEAFLSQFSNDYAIVKYGEPLFKRTNYPAGVDVYFPITSPVSVSQTIVIPDVNYTGSLLLEQQPVMSIDSVTGDVSGALATSLYSLTKDTGLFKGTNKAADAVTILNPGISDNTITVNYIYNSFPESVQAEFDDPANKAFGQNLLARESTQVLIVINIAVKLATGASLVTVQDSIATVSESYILNLGQGGDVIKNDLVAISKVSGVLAIDYNQYILAPTGGGEVTPLGDVTINSTEYAVLDSVVATEIV